MDIISVVLGADTKKDRTKDSIKIIEYAFANYKMVDTEYMIREKFDEVIENTKFEVIKGISNDIKLDLDEIGIKLYPVDKNSVKDVEVEVEIEKTLEAPITKGKSLRKNNFEGERK